MAWRVTDRRGVAWRVMRGVDKFSFSNQYAFFVDMAQTRVSYQFQMACFKRALVTPLVKKQVSQIGPARKKMSHHALTDTRMSCVINVSVFVPQALRIVSGRKKETRSSNAKNHGITNTRRADIL